MELHPLSDREFVEKSVNKDTDSSGDIQIVVSQTCSNITECKCVQATIDNDKNHQRLAGTVEEAKTEKNGEIKDVKTASSEGMQNNSKVIVIFYF